MNEYYKDDLATIYHNNFQDILTSLNYDYIITDPPYNVGYKYLDYKDKMPQQEYITMLSHLNDSKTIMIHYAEDFCGDVGEAMGRPNKCVSWCYNSNLQRQSRMIAWFGCSPDLTRVKQPYKNPKDKRIQKRMEQGFDGTRLYDWWDDIQLIKNVSGEKNLKFTNQIPIALLERIILLTTNEGDTILDPFFGSGSLYFACKNTNRKCIGIEQSIKHLEVFQERRLKHLSLNNQDDIKREDAERRSEERKE
jgi:site-specific DNA-methyltransferase (adenine-specific)